MDKNINISNNFNDSNNFNNSNDSNDFNYYLFGAFILIIILGIGIYYFYKKKDNNNNFSTTGYTKSNIKDNSTINSITESNIIPIDCVVSEWEECNKPCDGGERSRSVLYSSLNGGKPCPPLKEICNTQECDIDCKVSEWSTCSSDCGGGIQERKILINKKGNGKPCPELVRICNMQECDVDCIVGDWKPCSKQCDTGVQYRDVIRGKQGNGKECPSLLQYCNTEPCNVDCQVGPWSECNISCGTCEVKREIIVPKKGNGKECPELTGIFNTFIPCDRNCEVGEWSECSKPCGGGKKTRKMIFDKIGLGNSCPPLEESCNTHDCPLEPIGVNARYLLIKKGSIDNIQLSEIKVYDKNSNSDIVILNSNNIKTNSNLQKLYESEKLIDNNINTMIISNEDIKIDFGKIIDVTKIEIVPISDIKSQQNHILQLLDSNNNIVWSTNLITLIKPNSLHAFYTRIPLNYNYISSSSGLFAQMGDNYEDWVVMGTPEDCARKCNSNNDCDGFSYSKVKQTDPIYSQEGYWCFFSDKNENVVDIDDNFNYYKKIKK